MAKQQSSKSSAGCTKQVCTPAAPKKVADRNLMGVNPRKQQFEPTDAAPIRQQARMAGD